MTLATDLGGVGMPMEQARLVGQSAFVATTAAGTATGTATAIPQYNTNINVTTASSQTGVRLPSNMIRELPYQVYNTGTLAANVYPPTGTAFNGQATNIPFVVGVGQMAVFTSKTAALTVASIVGAGAYGGQAAQAVTATADGLTTGLITFGSTVVIITSAGANNIATLPGIVTNNIPIGYTIRGRVAATGCEIRTPASSNETINGVDADASEAALAANAGFTAVVESATGWLYIAGAATVPD